MLETPLRDVVLLVDSRGADNTPGTPIDGGTPTRDEYSDFSSFGQQLRKSLESERSLADLLGESSTSQVLQYTDNDPPTS